jgi:predicted DNA-binding transcriptional regulator AlpA
MSVKTARALRKTSRVLSLEDLSDIKGIRFHRNTLRRLWQSGEFPRPFHLSPRKMVWREDSIDAWIASKVEAA